MKKRNAGIVYAIAIAVKGLSLERTIKHAMNG
jgi:hypothetical protein